MAFSVWIDSAAAIAAAVAAGFAGWSATISLKQFNAQVKEKEESERPRLLPINTNISIEVKSILTDWDLNKRNLTPIKEKFVRSPINMINTGKSFAVNIEYRFRLLNNTDEFNNFDDENGYSLNFIKSKNNFFTISAKDNFEHKLYSDDENYVLNNQDVRVDMNTIQYHRYHPLLKSEESTVLFIPHYFVVLTNHFIIQYSMLNDDDVELPRLLLRLKYNDQHQNEYVDIYEMTSSKKQMRMNDLYYEGWIDFQLIHSESLKKRSPRYF